MKKKIAVAAVIAVVILPVIVIFAAPGAVYRAGGAIERCRAGLEEKRVTARGIRFAYLEGGRGEAVVLLHGFTAHKDFWTRFARFLTPSYRVIIPDIPGFGESDRPAGARYDIESQTARIVRFTGALGLTSFHLAGNSMGGQIAGCLAARHPGEVITLGLFDAGGVTPPRKTEFQEKFDRGENILLPESVDDYARLMNLNFTRQPWFPGSVKRWFGERAMAERAFNRKVGEDIMADRMSLEPLLGRIRARTLVLWGSDDRVLDPSGADVFARGIPGSVKVLMKDCGHTPMLERPEEAAGIYLDFLKKGE